jgi:hypothetical protein
MGRSDWSVRHSIVRRQSDERGTNLVEFAITLPVIILLFMGIFDLGRAFYVSHALSQSAREGARYAIIHPDSIVGIVQYVRTHAVGVDPASLNVTITFPSNDWVHVMVSCDFYPVTPLIAQFIPGGGDHLHLSSASEMQIER